MIKYLTVAALMLVPTSAWTQEPVQLIDTHIHYSHDAWDMLPPVEAIKILRKAGLRQAFVSSSSDDGTQMLYKQAPDLIVPVLRPYRKRGELSTWFKDPTVVDMIADRLAKNTYAGIGEFHIFGTDANRPVMKSVIQLAKKHGVFLHAHSDAAAIMNIFKQDPDARVLWAHSGFDEPREIDEMLTRYPNLRADLAFRNEHATADSVDPDWRKLFEAHPDRIMVGTDTFAPERWYYVVEHANWTRTWLKDLPKELAEKIAWKNARALADWALKK
ncbi:MAG: amidohydrolase family protein [Alphaproteobacteria bacterium]|jgi:predicted TIM-barrel fold metal-dependent hydrolase|nr:amidohydrolase family protein [Alphaproteobacteria bacterium]MBT4086482.1 amidohydrolase family protein [Alphaproteobacteria bacterium]MBT4546462.1 amidohydrolase family protein [Alphaproteobacteria bacterium]MBT7745463.1 amidohydrolase family protein [Alphaproteobacteria bacterium]